MPRYENLSQLPSARPVTRLRRLRQAAGYTQEQLASLAGLSSTTVWNLEQITVHRDMDRVKLGSIRRIARVLGIAPVIIYPALQFRTTHDPDD